MAEPDSFRFDAFISYRHVEPDRTWAKWLHRSLETFKTPRAIVRQGAAPRIARVFRDEEELPASSDLSGEIDAALAQSRFLIVVCSPRTPLSQWVNQEVLRFREMERHDRILALLIEGEPAASFPRALCEIRTAVVDPQGGTTERIEDVEPLAADVRASRFESPRQLKRMARLRFSAALLGCRFDDLRQRHQERRVRNLTILSVAALVLVGVLAGLALVATSESRRADRRAEEAQRLLLQTYEELGRAELLANEPLRAAPYLAEAYARGKRDPVLRFLLAEACRPLDAMVGALPHDRFVDCMAVSPDGSHLLVGTVDHNAHLWDVASLEEIATLEGHTGRIAAVAISPDGSRLVTGSRDWTGRLWDARNSKLIATLEGQGGPVLAVAFSPDGELVLTISSDDSVFVWDSTDGRRLAILKGHKKPFVAPTFARDGIVLTASDTAVSRWDARSGIELDSLELSRIHADSRFLAFSPDGMYVVTGTPDGTVRVSDVIHGRTRRTLEGHTNVVIDAAFSADGSRIVTRDYSFGTRVWHSEGPGDAIAIREHDLSAGIHSATLSRDGSLLMIRGDRAHLWDVRSGTDLPFLRYASEVSSAEFAPDEETVVTAGRDESVRIWDISRRRTETTMEDSVVYLHRCAGFNADGTQMVTIGDDSAHIWDLDSAQEIQTLFANDKKVRAAAFSPDGQRVVTGAEDGSVRVWDTNKALVLIELKAHTEAVNSAAFSPDGSRILTAGADGTRIWDARDGQPILALDQQRRHRYIQVARFAPDGSRVLTGAGDGTARIWDAKGGHELAVLTGHTKRIKAAAFSPDGTVVVTGSEDRTARLWDAKSGKPLALLGPHAGEVWCVAFSPDGTLVVTAGKSPNLRIWDAKRGRALAALEHGKFDWISAARFSERGTNLTTVALGRRVFVWDVAPESRDADEILALVRAKCPNVLANGQLVPREAASKRNR